MKHQALLTIQAKLKLAIIVFYFSVEIDSGEILASLWQEEENFEVLKRCYIQAYNYFFAVVWKINSFSITQQKTSWIYLVIAELQDFIVS